MKHTRLANKVVLFAALAMTLAGAAIRAEVVEQVLVKVNGEIFTKTDLETRQVAALRQMGQQIDPKSDPSAAQQKQMIVSQVQQNEVLSRIAVSDEEARQYYDAHKSEFTSAQTVTLREIFVSVPGDGKTLNVGRDEEARAKAEAIRQRALSGESFEKLAADLSDAPSKANAGLIGPLNLSDLSQDVRALIDPIKLCDLTVV